ncbi:SMI1/KNR4 family protein [Streptomyces mirabilis]|uniref:SMI1/KNR4 family protein n=1 Tax=Streptomyces mirabilis TaxID=68239 RepID=UPI0036B5E3ED
MSEDEIIERVQAFAQTHRLPPPASEEAVVELEAIVGWPMPTLLRRLYLEVANGGFGPSSRVMSLTHTGQWFSDEESLLQFMRAAAAHTDPSDPPRHTVPLMTLGCAVWWFVDFSTPDGRMWGWEPNARCEQHRLFPERFTLAQWLTDWLDGNRAFPEPPPLTDCPDC